jgi:hypothetical protein
MAGSGQGSSANAASFGQDAGAADRAAATKTVQDFLSAWINEDPAKACTLMAASTKQNLAAFSSQLKSPDCPGEARTVRSAMPAKMLSRLQGVHVTAVRVEGGRGFVIYRARGASWALPVLREGSAWKVGAIAGYSIP